MAKTARNAGAPGDRALIPGSGRPPGGGNGSPSSVLAWRILKDRGAWWATVHRVTKSQARLNVHT